MMPNTEITRPTVPSMPATPVTRKPVAALFSGSVAKTAEGGKSPQARPVTRPSERPTRMPRKMLRDFVATTSITTTGMSITRLTGFESASIAPPSYVPPMPPRMAKSTSAMLPATMEYLKRVFTQPPTSAGRPSRNCCVEALAMVVSEMGARLSPKMAPETMAPARNMGLPPRMMPAG